MFTVASICRMLLLALIIQDKVIGHVHLGGLILFLERGPRAQVREQTLDRLWRILPKEQHQEQQRRDPVRPDLRLLHAQAHLDRRARARELLRPRARSRRARDAAQKVAVQHLLQNLHRNIYSSKIAVSLRETRASRRLTIRVPKNDVKVNALLNQQVDKRVGDHHAAHRSEILRKASGQDIHLKSVAISRSCLNQTHGLQRHARNGGTPT